MKNGPYELVVAPDDYPGKRYRGRYCYEHHLVWWREHGSLPASDECLHHVNENRRDNRLSNLRLKLKKKHSSEHTSRRGRRVAQLCCPTCGVELVRATRLTHLARSKGKLTFCSSRCVGRFNFHTASKQRVAAAVAANVVEIFRQTPGSRDPE